MPATQFGAEMRTDPPPLAAHPSSGNTVIWLTAALCCYLVIYYFVGERVPYNGGLGFDGYFYGTLAQDVPGVLTRRIPEYYLDRILPSVIVWLSAKSLGLSLAGADQVVSAFHIYDSLLLVAASLAWVRLSGTLKLSAEVATIGWACLFLNWIVLKQYLYFAVQTDTTAFALGVCAALCVIERRLFLLAMVAFTASFAWKTVMPLTLLLIVLPHPAATPAPGKIPTWLVTALSLTAAAAAAAISFYVTLVLRFRLGAGAAQVDLSTLPLSIATLALYAFYVAHSVPLAPIATFPRVGRLGPIAFFVAIWGLRAIILAIILKFFANNQTILDLFMFLESLFATSVAKPAIIVIAMITEFGPGFILLLWYLPRVMRAAASHSLGSLLVLIATMVMAMDTESRQLAFAYPLMIAFLCATLQEVGFDRKFAAGFLASSFLLSKVYLPLNAIGMQAISSREPLTDATVLLQFPWQWFLMNIGVYSGWIGYAANLTLAAGVAVVLFVVQPRGLPEILAPERVATSDDN